jgi:hypothetical protein
MIVGLIAAMGAALVCAFIYMASRSVVFGWYCLLVANLLYVALGSNQIMLGGLHLDVVDMASLVLLGAGIIRSLNRINLPGNARIVSLAYLLIFAFSLVRGIDAFGIQQASNQARGLVGEVLAMLYFFTTPTDPETIKKILVAYLRFGAALIVVAILHYAGMSIGMTAVDEKDRALPSASGEAIALCFFIGLGWITYRRTLRNLRWLLPVFAGMAVVLQHRTVWTVMAVCSVMIMLIDAKLVRRLVPLAIATSVLATGLAVFIYGTKGEATTQFEDSVTNSGTWLWRVEAWENSLHDEDQTIYSIMLGQPIGKAFVRFDSDSGGYQEVPPHSEYIVQYLRVGCLGLAFFLVFLITPLIRLISLQRRDPLALFPSTSVWCLLVAGAIVYGITYGFDAPTIALVGLANALLLSLRSRAVQPSRHAVGLEDSVHFLQTSNEVLS